MEDSKPPKFESRDPALDSKTNGDVMGIIFCPVFVSFFSSLSRLSLFFFYQKVEFVEFEMDL